MEKTHTHSGDKKVSDEHRRSKFREVSSRYLQSVSSSPQNRIEFVPISSPNPTQISKESNPILSDSRKHRSHDSGLLRKLWPSAAGKSSKHESLGKHLEEEREKDFKNSNQNSSLLNRQKSSSAVFSRFGSGDKNESSTKENHKPFFSGSMRYTGKFKFSGRSSSSSSVENYDMMIPGRLSVDETALRQRSFGGRLEDSENHDSGSEISDFGSNSTSLGSPYIGSSPVSYMSPTVSSSFRKSGKEVSSKYKNEKHRRGTTESNSVSQTVNDSSATNKSSGMKKANWITTPSRWGSSLVRSSPPQPFQKPSSQTHSNAKPPTSPSKGKLPPTSPNRAKGVGSFISLGLDLFKKPYPSSNGGVTVVSGPSTAAESVHQLRLLHNRLMQWRYVNARGETVNKNITNQVEKKLLCAYDALLKVQHSVLQKKIQLEREKLEMKLNHILCSQIKPLESWSHGEKQHLSAVSMITDSLHSVVCRIPLIEGAVVETESASFALRYASDLASSIESMLSSFISEADKTAAVLAELAEVAAQEKAMLEECLELSRFVSKLEIEEWSLKCHVLQQQQQQQQREKQQQITV